MGNESQKKAEYTSDQAAKYISNAAKAVGVEQLVIGYKSPEGLITTHLQAISPAVGFNILITLFGQLIDAELQAPGATPEHKKAVQQFHLDFLESVRSFNKKNQ